MEGKEGSILLLVVMIMVIAGLYATTALFDVRGTVDQERYYRTKKQIDYLQNAVQDYRINNPASSLGAFGNLVSQGSYSSCTLSYTVTYSTMVRPLGWCGPYFDTSLFLGGTNVYQQDAWGTNFSLSTGGSTMAYSYTITSCGENKACGDADDLSVGPF